MAKFQSLSIHKPNWHVSLNDKTRSTLNSDRNS